MKLNSDFAILDYQISRIKQQLKQANIYVVTGFESDKVKKHIETKYKSINIICDEEYTESNQTNAVLTAIQKIENITNLLIISSGILIKNYPKIKTGQQSTIYYLDNAKDNFDLGSINNDSNYLFYGLPTTWAEMVFLDKNTLSIMKEYSKSKYGQLYLFEIINNLMENRIDFDSCTISKKDIFKVLSHKDITKAKRFSSL